MTLSQPALPLFLTLLLLLLTPIFADSPTPPTALPPPYIPLKEWKQRKLDHVRHRVHPPPPEPRFCPKLIPFLPLVCPLPSIPVFRLNLTVPKQLSGALLEAVTNPSYIWKPHAPVNVTATSTKTVLKLEAANRTRPIPKPTNAKAIAKPKSARAKKKRSPASGTIQKPTPTVVNQKPFNFASADAGARILSHSPHILGAKNILLSHDDKYLVEPCRTSSDANPMRWVDIELSEELVLESVEIANFEYYSSSPRTVALLGATEYPPKDTWSVIGVFPFRHVRYMQRFVSEKRGVVRYLRVVFAGSQGGEYYCPISSVRVFGKSLIADWKDFVEKPKEKEKVETNDNNKGDSEEESSKKKDEEVSEDDAEVIEAVRGGALTAVDGDDNIFRKVTRMIRLLELNQTLTNQYIDTQLSRFAKALRDSYNCVERVSKKADTVEDRMQEVMMRLEREIDDMKRQALRRDLVIGVLVVVIAFLLGSQWVALTTLAGGKIMDEEDRRESLSGGSSPGNGRFEADNRSISSMDLWKRGDVLSEVSSTLER